MRLLFSPETVHEKGENAVTGFVSNEFAPRKDVRPAVGRGRLFIFQGPSYPSVPWVNLGVFECQRFISVTSLFQSSSPQRSHWTTQKTPHIFVTDTNSDVQKEWISPVWWDFFEQIPWQAHEKDATCIKIKHQPLKLRGKCHLFPSCITIIVP